MKLRSVAFAALVSISLGHAAPPTALLNQLKSEVKLLKKLDVQDAKSEIADRVNAFLPLVDGFQDLVEANVATLPDFQALFSAYDGMQDNLALDLEAVSAHFYSLCRSGLTTFDGLAPTFGIYPPFLQQGTNSLLDAYETEVQKALEKGFAKIRKRLSQLAKAMHLAGYHLSFSIQPPERARFAITTASQLSNALPSFTVDGAFAVSFDATIDDGAVLVCGQSGIGTSDDVQVLVDGILTLTIPAGSIAGSRYSSDSAASGLPAHNILVAVIRGTANHWRPLSIE